MKKDGGSSRLEKGREKKVDAVEPCNQLRH